MGNPADTETVEPITAATSRWGSSFWLLAALALALLWLVVINSVPELRASRIPPFLSRVVIHSVVLGGLWLGLARASFDYATRLRVWLAVAITYTAWVVLISWLALGGAFEFKPGKLSPLPLAIFLPLIVGLPLLLRWRRLTAVLDATPPAWLVGL